MIKYLICLLLLINFLFPGKVLADIQVTADKPLFPASISWYPGLSVTKFFTVKNLSSEKQTVYLEAFNTFQTGDVDKIFLVSFGVGEKTLREFWNDGLVNLSGLAAGTTGIYKMTIRMSTSSGNIYQKQQAKFDLIIGFVGTNFQATISGILGEQEKISTPATTTRLHWWQWILKIIWQVLQWLYEIFRRILAFFYPAAH